MNYQSSNNFPHCPTGSSSSSSSTEHRAQSLHSRALVAAPAAPHSARWLSRSRSGSSLFSCVLHALLLLLITVHSHFKGFLITVPLIFEIYSINKTWFNCSDISSWTLQFILIDHQKRLLEHSEATDLTSRCTIYNFNSMYISLLISVESAWMESTFCRLSLTTDKVWRTHSK